MSDGESLLQLTPFGRYDTGSLGAVLSRDQQRVLFTASANPWSSVSAQSPFQSNPHENCQLFSVDTLGGDLRQLTNFDEGQPSLGGCGVSQPPPDGCFVSIVGQDLGTDTVVFESNCHPFDTNPYSHQVFSIRFDGTDVRQLTDTRGFETALDGTVTVELPGPVAYTQRQLGR